MRAQFYVTLWVETQIQGETFSEALENAKRLSWSKLVAVKGHIDVNDVSLQLAGVFDDTQSGGL